jgi:hypothetical protein
MVKLSPRLVKATMLMHRFTTDDYAISRGKLECCNQLCSMQGH